jgi:hypothetical protein
VVLWGQGRTRETDRQTKSWLCRYCSLHSFWTKNSICNSKFLFSATSILRHKTTVAISPLKTRVKLVMLHYRKTEREMSRFCQWGIIQDLYWGTLWNLGLLKDRRAAEVEYGRRLSLGIALYSPQLCNTSLYSSAPLLLFASCMYIFLFSLLDSVLHS